MKDIEALEPEQRSDHLREPLPRRSLSRSIVVLLWVLRIYVLIAVPIVIYAFVRALRP